MDRQSVKGPAADETAVWKGITMGGLDATSIRTSETAPPTNSDAIRADWDGPNLP